MIVDGLRKRYDGFTAVDGLSFKVDEGEIFGIIGANGSGKTTTVECAQGLRLADEGSVRVFGLDPQTDRTQLRSEVGSQLQESELPDRLRVWEALDLFASISPGSADWPELLDEWGLTEKRDAAFASLSGGQRQRLLVALALVNRPRLVFLDEMTTGLDPAARRVAWDLIDQIRARGTTVVLVTHFMDEAERLCDRLAVFRSGRIIAEGSPAQLVAEYAGDASVRFSTDQTDLSWLADAPGVTAIDRAGSRVTVQGTGPLLAHTAAALVAHGIAPVDLEVERKSLEDAFLALTDGEEPE
ncbi:MAG: ABC transporter ATP-binding protein [Acidimicrobiales bacterium]|nr:ABC transporter ATP-binding protein [Acidimicrobiales bacterium]